MFGGAFGGKSDSTTPGGEDEFGKSFLSDIKNFFGSMAYKGGVGVGAISGQTT